MEVERAIEYIVGNSPLLLVSHFSTLYASLKQGVMEQIEAIIGLVIVCISTDNSWLSGVCAASEKDFYYCTNEQVQL